MKLDAKLVVLLIAVVAVATVGSAFLTSWVFTSREGTVPAVEGLVSARSESFDPELVWNAGEFTVNLASNTSFARYLKTNMSFRVNTKTAVNELEKRRVQVQDRVISTLRMTAAVELQQPDGLMLLKQRLLDEINQLLASTGGRAYDVYLSELIIQ